MAVPPAAAHGYPRLEVTEPDLFVVCKNCSAEVSPYVTECPYCGQRVRKRAPKIEREAPEPETDRRGRARPTRLPRLRRGEIPGIAPEVRPVATIGLVALSLALAVALRVDPGLTTELALLAPLGDEWWRVLATPLLHPDNLGYLFIAMVAVGIFGSHVERRFGRLATVLVFLVCGTAGAALCVALETFPAVGANGAGLGLLCAWLVDDRRALRRGDDRETDMLGVYVIAAALVLLSVVEPDASIVAAAGGAAAGSACGLLLGLTRR
ncbi:MAG: rhomboid family intramembrane serine protease [Thermoleophilaceae bacterium]